MIGELERFANVIEWLDKARWTYGGWWDGWNHKSVCNLSADQKVLAHWITYITDMQMSAKLVWTQGLPVFATIVQQYGDGADPRNLLRDKRVKKELGKVDTLKIDENLKFTPRYPWHYDQIQRTLEILVDYDRSLVQLMKSVVAPYRDNQRGLRPLAHALYLLTYANPNQYSTKDTREILRYTRGKLDKRFQEWDEDTTKGGQKRLWAALRDYVKHDKLRNCVEEVFPSWLQCVEPSDLELPGDVWNDVFANKLLYSLAERTGVNTQGKRGRSNVNTPTLARRIYNAVKASSPSTSFYPEQLDVSFDFASRMCDKSLCDICVFGRNEADDVCARPGPPKLCSILLILTGYKQTCKIEGCPIVAGDGKGLCEGQNMC